MAGLQDTGYVVRTGNEILSAIRARYEELTNETPSWDDDTFLGVFSLVVSEELSDLEQGLLGLWSSQNINSASARQLERLVQIALLSRQEATASRATVSLDGTPGTIIPASKVLECTANGERWQLLEDVTLPGDGTFECLSLGPVEAPATTLSTIITPVSGWDTASNASAADIGEFRETDAQLRQRFFKSLQQGTSSTVPGIYGSVSELDFIDSVLVLENTSLVTATIGGLSMPGKSVAVVVSPSVLTTEEREELAYKLLENVAAGIERVGSDSFVVTDAAGRGYTMYWNYAIPLSVDITVGYTPLIGYDTTDLDAAIDTAVTNYMAGLDGGQDVRSLPLCSVISNIDGVYAATVLINGVSDLAIPDTQVAQLNSIVTTPAAAVSP